MHASSRSHLLTGHPPPSGPWLFLQAPVIVSLQAYEVNPYYLIERHLRTDVLAGPEKFWKL